jgi:hypothetical protein
MNNLMKLAATLPGCVMRPTVRVPVFLAVVAMAGISATAQELPQLTPPGTLSPFGSGAAAPAAGGAVAAQPAAPVSQAQADKEWLTSYYLVHQGYQLQHLPAIEATLNKMSPSQLNSLRDMYDKKHTLEQQQQALFNQWNAYQVSRAQAWSQSQQQQLNQFSAAQSQGAGLAELQINQMHQEAAANAAAKRLSYPGMVGPYGSPYGYGGLVHPFFNPLGY